ncbi:bifunctional diaminohydroxyphosphoribosylaminopyrimidine deaminase/5-amino-6-(5-phosphoribosylamino)uracil reductase RibD [Canibacter sp. lx-72]|nr:bifunctional diaminohydroxyphosphoribosylaminopyrimidine deaminase/5-amino-6-(5-phosphoribosylamino)uracil reductase RibD [Canibacter zhuwentaonis]MBT1018143.1 bifunctional diaminohydroxyphosphoribosylaminopyrimidine deaminase/5-amino-6-(5-phosphoribosylamino)uracil reductase RibD [Canibacter zhuwentaonis]MBT1035322.1 bifunctional diaminohydroxyphosphoribosylaminopyrimidine deaminase/5-amino-6-(5-phosphoribosylamino)uracil reductase RibD [Canibacter zhuwentaonis]
MRDALAAAAKGPSAGLNPQVGCVILDAQGNTLATGYHAGAGTAHAEIKALELLDYKAPGATLVVTMEPCNHHGETPPCTDAVIAAGVARVVYGSTDPGRRSGGGAATLQRAGIKTQGGVLSVQTDSLLANWQQWLAKNITLPKVTAKWAQSLDGRVFAADGSSKWITGAAARANVHQQRARFDAIAVGGGTLRADNPALTARNSAGELLVSARQQPLPVVFSATKIPATARVREHPALKTIAGAADPLQYSGADLRAHLQDMQRHGINSVLLEGGPALISAFFRENLVSEVLIYQSPTLLGGAGTALTDIGVASIIEMLRLQRVERTLLDGDELIRGFVL